MLFLSGSLGSKRCLRFWSIRPQDLIEPSEMFGSSDYTKEKVSQNINKIVMQEASKTSARQPVTGIMMAFVAQDRRETSQMW